MTETKVRVHQGDSGKSVSAREEVCIILWDLKRSLDTPETVLSRNSANDLAVTHSVGGVEIAVSDERALSARLKEMRLNPMVCAYMKLQRVSAVNS